MVFALAGDSTTTISMNSQRVRGKIARPQGFNRPAVVAAIDGIVNPGCQTPARAGWPETAKLKRERGRAPRTFSNEWSSAPRSEEGRVGKGGRSRWSPYH